MRAVRFGGMLAAAVAGLSAMGAALQPGSDAGQLAAARAAMAKALPTPRLYRMTRTGGLTVSANVLEMCLGAAFLDRLIDGAASSPTEAGAVRKGCTSRYATRRDGGFHLDLACDKAAGAARTTHLELDGTIKDLRQASEMVLEDPQSGEARIVSIDLRMTDIGACPAGMAPGQVRGPDGKVMDGPAGPVAAAKPTRPR
jgi:hypothetical protein